MKLFQKAKSLLKQTTGMSMLDYGIIVGLISITGITIILRFGDEIRGIFIDAGGEVQNIQFGGLENGSQVPGGWVINGAIVPESSECWTATPEIPSIYYPHSLVYSCFNGDSGANTIEASERDDTIDGSYGDDVIIYKGGADYIFGHGGFDTLDLTAFNSADVVFDIEQPTNQHDVLFSVNGGPTVEMHYQARYAAGNSRTSFEQVSFADETLLGDAIIQRAVDDQGTPGEDVIWGSTINDIVQTSGAGADHIRTEGGDDTVIYDSGDDILDDDSGFDTLDLSKYNAAGVTFDINMATNQHDALIATPDGNIELHYQVRYDSSHSRFAFDQIIFADETIDGDGILFRAVDDQGTSGNDHIDGTIMTDTISPRGGNDIIDSNDGDDTIIYEAGNDTILRGNAGVVTLDLSKYNPGDVEFEMGPMNAYDVFVNTPDGRIELDYQVRYDIGASANISTVTFASGPSLNEMDIRSRAISDQETSGNDTVLGTRFNDSFAPGAGNDSVSPNYGDDVIVYDSGADIIVRGNQGADTLDLSKYNDTDVVFSLSGAGQHDVFITTPDGSIELDYQVRQAVGHVDSNIETIIFSNMTIDEAEILARAQLNP